MLNQTGVFSVSATTRKTILVDERNSTAFSVVVSNDGVTADSEGKKIIKAGTPAYGDLTARNTPFKVSGTGNPVGVILHDVDVTNGNANSQVVVFGFIDISKVESEVATALQSAEFKMIQLVQ